MEKKTTSSFHGNTAVVDIRADAHNKRGKSRKNMDLFSLKGKNALILGGGGVLGASLAQGLAGHGAAVAVADLMAEQAESLADGLQKAGAKAKGYRTDAMNEESLQETCRQVLQDFGRIDVLVSAVGGNRKDATSSDSVTFFDLPSEAIEKVVDLNLFAGAILPAKVFGKVMSENPGGGSIINVSSMNAFRPLTRIAAYSAAKAAVSNFTQWLAVYLAQAGHANLRVNAIAPGFFLTEQNRFLLTEQETGALTQRGRQILDHTPMGRFGDPDDLIGSVVWLASDASRFVTGIIVPIDGGFSAYSGV